MTYRDFLPIDDIAWLLGAVYLRMVAKRSTWVIGSIG